MEQFKYLFAGVAWDVNEAVLWICSGYPMDIHGINCAHWATSRITCFKVKNGIIMCGALEMIQLYDSNTGEQVMDFFL